MRRWYIYRHQEQGMWKNRPEPHDRLFHSVAQPPNWTREEQGNNGGFIRRFPNCRSNRRIKLERLKSIRYERQSRPPIVTVKLVLRLLDPNGGFIRWLGHRFTKCGETKGEAKVISEGGPRAKPNILSCMRGRFRIIFGKRITRHKHTTR